MTDSRNNVHSKGVRLICGPYLAIIRSVPIFAQADNDKMQVQNGPYAPKMNIIGILLFSGMESSV